MLSQSKEKQIPTEVILKQNNIFTRDETLTDICYGGLKLSNTVTIQQSRVLLH